MTPINKAFGRFILRADRQEDDVLERTFVEFGSAANSLMSIDHQIVFGRRGTGKTHLLTHIKQNRRADGEVAIQLDLRTIGSSNGIYGDTTISVVQRASRLLLEVLSAIHSSLLDSALETNTKVDLGTVGPLLDQYLDVIREVKVVGTTTVESTNTIELSENASLKIAGGISSKGPQLSVDTGFGTTGKDAQTAKVIRQGQEVAHVSFGSVGTAIRKLVAALPKRRLWLLIDEWSEIPQELQPYLADLLRRALLPAPGISVKIAAIEQRSRFLIPNRQTGNIGLELGADVAATVSLDEYMVFDNDETQAVAFFKKLVLSHVQDMMKDMGLEPPKDEAEMISSGFTQVKAFEELVRAAEGVPRDAMHLLTYASQRASVSTINVNDVRAAALRHYQGQKEPNVSVNEQAKNLLHWIIDQVIKARQTKAFLLESGQRDELIDFLYDERVLHVLRKGISAQDNPGVRYHVYGIDFGCYVDLINTVKAPKGLLDLGTSQQEFSEEIPRTDFRSIRRCVLNLDSFYNRNSMQAELSLTPAK